MVFLHWNFVDALFMVLTTVTTVGYEAVHPLGEGGRIFTMTVIVFGVGTMLYTLATFGELLVEEHLARYARMRGMERRIAGLSDHFVICGYGRMGTLEEFLVPSSSKVLGWTLRDSGMPKAGANVLAIRKRSGQLRMNPPETQVLDATTFGSPSALASR